MMTVLTILTPICAFIAFLAEAYVVAGGLGIVSLMLWRAMLHR